MGKTYDKLPTKEQFADAVEAAHGNITKIAQIFGVSRQTVYNWCKEDPTLKDAIEDSKMKLYDQALEAARALVVGIPRIDSTGRLVGWEERPDPSMVRYILSTLGKDEGFTERRDVTSNGEALFPKVINIVADDGTGVEKE